MLDLSLLWKAAWDVFPYFDRVRDWDETYRAFLPQVAAARPGRETWMLLAAFMARLEDGHTMFDFPASMREQAGALPFALRYMCEGYLLSACPKGWEAHLLAPVLSINGRPFSAWLEEVCRYAYHVDDYVPAWRLEKILPLLLPENNELETPAGRAQFSLKTGCRALIAAPCPSSSRAYRPVSDGKLEIRLYEGNLLYAALPDCQYPDAAVEIARAIGRTRPDGVVLDLRDNIGGMTRYGGQVAELFISGEFHGCRKRTRLSRGVDIASGSQFMRMTRDELACLDGAEAPQRCIDMLHGRSWEEYTDTYGAPGHIALYDGPCVLLASRRTVSAAEDTLAFFRSSHRAAVVGEPTCGTTGTPLLLRMPGGGSARVCAVGYRLLDGTAFIGRGIAPDILLPATREDLSRGEDAQLDRALTLLEGGTVTA